MTLAFSATALLLLVAGCALARPPPSGPRTCPPRDLTFLKIGKELDLFDFASGRWFFHDSRPTRGQPGGGRGSDVNWAAADGGPTAPLPS
jgi:hypothetical protein